MFKKFLTTWHPMRMLRMGVSIAAIIQGIQLHDYMVASVGLIFGVATIFNVGCCSVPGSNCSSGSCSVEESKDK